MNATEHRNNLYVEALSVEMNSAIANFLDTSAGECAVGLKRCADGQDHPLWRCSPNLYDHLMANRPKFGNNFRIFAEIGEGNYVLTTITEQSTTSTAAAEAHAELETVLKRRAAHRRAELAGKA